VTATAALLRTGWLVQARHRIPALVAGLAVPWTVLAAVLPATAPYLLFIEVATVGTFVAGALVVADRATGVTAALAVSPARPASLLAARIAPLWTLTVLAAVPVLLAARAPDLPVSLGAIALTTLLLLAAGVGIAARRRTLMGFLTVAPWPLAPLLAVPLAVAAGLLTGPAWYAVPTTGTLTLLRGVHRYPAWQLLGYLALWTAATLAYAVHATTGPDPHRARATHRRPATRGRPSYPRADAANLTRETIIAPIAASPLLLGLVLRYALPPLTGWAERVHGLDLTRYLPILALLAVVVHVPVIAGMIGALMILDDRDDRALHAIRVSPLGVRRYLGYRLALVTGLAAAGLAVAAPLSGQVPASAWGACLLAVPLAPTFTLAVLAVAGNRVEGVAAVKALGVPSYAPLAAWWLTGAAGWTFAPLPTYWILRAWDGPRPAVIASGAICAGLWIVLLAPRALRRLAR
jgi:fluoroquinolone transport system permease protein